MSFQLRDDVSLVETSDCTVLLDQRHGGYWQTNATGALVLRALLDGKTDAEVGKLLSCTRRTAPDQATADA